MTRYQNVGVEFFKNMNSFISIRLEQSPLHFVFTEMKRMLVFITQVFGKEILNSV